MTLVYFVVRDDSPLIDDGVWELGYWCFGLGFEAIIDLDLLILSILSR